MVQTTLDPDVEALYETAEPPRPRPSRARWPVPVMAAGLAVVALAGAVLVDHAGRPAAVQSPAPVPVAGDPPADPLAITLSARDVSVVTQVYAPGEASGWHSHSGIHAVAVLSGALTVYDAECRPQIFEAGRPYVGGQQAHLVRNEGEAPVVMAVTYLSPSAANEATRTLSAPAGC